MSARAAFYGDDFTGSTDALAQFHRFGLRSLLFFRTPSPALFEQVAATHDVVGIAGIARSLPAEAIAAEIAPAFALFAALAPRFVQYKICSTCDSSERLGSFGPALRLGCETFGARRIPLVPAQPEFGRYTVFANHFAAADGARVRLDRHPTMAHHPSTPIDEADLRVFLARQTPLPIDSLDLVALDRAGETNPLAAGAGTEPRVVVVDVLEQRALPRIGRMILDAAPGATAFALGSGGLSYAIAAALTGRDAPIGADPAPAAREQLVVLSGSASPGTRAQIARVRERGWEIVALDPRELMNDAAAATERASIMMRRALAAGRSAAVASMREPGDRAPIAPEVLAPVLGRALGILADDAIRSGIRRLVVAGGDSSSYAMSALDVYGIEIVGAIDVAAWLCALRSTQPHLDGIEVVLKGGQVGGVDFFEHARTGTSAV